MAHLLAHQGGWDESLVVLAPLLLLALVLWIATRRARDFDEDEDGPVEDDEPAAD